MPLAGKILGPEDGATGDHSYFNVFDGHTDTSYDYPFADGGWAGLDLGERGWIMKLLPAGLLVPTGSVPFREGIFMNVCCHRDCKPE